MGSFETGFTTELAAVRSQIQLEHRMFYGAPRWTKEGVGSLLLDPNAPVYVGEASDEIDDNWDDFIGGKCSIHFVKRSKYWRDSNDGGFSLFSRTTT